LKSAAARFMTPDLPRKTVFTNKMIGISAARMGISLTIGCSYSDWFNALPCNRSLPISAAAATLLLGLVVLRRLWAVIAFDDNDICRSTVLSKRYRLGVLCRGIARLRGW